VAISPLLGCGDAVAARPGLKGNRAGVSLAAGSRYDPNKINQLRSDRSKIAAVADLAAVDVSRQAHASLRRRAILAPRR
jgi:hypothetical protein